MITIKEAEEILKKEYHEDNFLYVVNDILLPDFVRDKHAVEFKNKIFTSVCQFGYSDKCDVAVFEVLLEQKTQNRRVTITQEMFRIMRGLGINNAVVAFANADKRNWRFSLLTSKYEFDGDKVIKVLSNPRRYSYSLGYGTKTKTAYDFLIGKGKVNSLDELINRFSVEIVNKQFYSEIAACFTRLVGGQREGKTYNKELNIHGVTDQNKYAEFAVRLIGRIVFCWFLKEKKSDNGISLIPDSLFSVNFNKIGGNYYHDVLEPLFFELLNTSIQRRKGKYAQDEFYAQIPYLNGGLFSPHADDHYKYSPELQCGQYGIITIPNEWFARFYDVLNQYNFTVDENTSYDIELSIDPEMLGRIFENLLAEINPETGENAKKSTGSFYTPRDIVDYMVDSSILEHLKTKTGIDENKLKALISYGKEDDELVSFSAVEKKAIVNALYTVTVLDPACGSGAFPIGVLQKIVYMLQEIDPDATLWFNKATENVSFLIRKEFEKKFNAGSLDYIRKLTVIQNSIFGIDIQPIAVEIARLRCFLSLVIEEKVYDDEPNRGINPLPNLDFKFIVANSLIPLESKGTLQMSIFENQDHIDALRDIREEYFNADSERRIELKLEFKTLQQDMLLNTIANYQKQASVKYQLLSEWKPFESQPTTWFDPEWMFGIRDGFDIVIANPPYIQLQDKSIRSIAEEYSKQGYVTFAKTGDIYCLFYEAGYNNLKDGGILTFITSNKWMRAGYGEKLRNFLSSKTNPIFLIDFAGQKVFESATVDVNILLFKKESNAGQTQACIIKDKCRNNLCNYIQQNTIKQSFNYNDSWTISNQIGRSIKKKLIQHGLPLKQWNIVINFGIKTGCNEAFIIDEKTRSALIDEDAKSAEIIRPILRGRDVDRYKYNFAGQYLIATFPSRNYNIDDYSSVKKHLLSFGKEKLEQTGTTYNKGTLSEFTSRKKTNNKWFETQDSIAYWDDFSKPKIVWARLMRIHKSEKRTFPRFCLVPEDMFVVDSLCFFTGSDLKYIVAFLNSSVAAYYFLKNIAILDDGGMQMRQQFVEDIPVPVIDERCKVFEDIITLYDYIKQQPDTVDTTCVERKIDQLFYDMLGLTKEEISMIELELQELESIK